MAKKMFNIWYEAIRGLVVTSPVAYLERRLTNPKARGAGLRVRGGEMKLGMNMEYQTRVDDTRPRLPAEYRYRSSGEERKNSSALPHRPCAMSHRR